MRFFLGCFNGKARTLGPRLTLNSDDVTLKQKIKHHDFLEISENLFEAPEPPKTGEPELHTNWSKTDETHVKTTQNRELRRS